MYNKKSKTICFIPARGRSNRILNKNLKKGQILIDMSSTKKKTAVRIAKKVRASKAHFLDAPVSGGTAGAKGSKLAIMVGGEKKYLIK